MYVYVNWKLGKRRAVSRPFVNYLNRILFCVITLAATMTDLHTRVRLRLQYSIILLYNMYTSVRAVISGDGCVATILYIIIVINTRRYNYICISITIIMIIIIIIVIIVKISAVLVRICIRHRLRRTYIYYMHMRSRNKRISFGAPAV